MGKIGILDSALAAKIAAGEVIDRPASAVKELVENSIDAGATAIRIEIVRGGKELIRVSDNGCGMSREDAELSLKKHATSKISAMEDLGRITSMGFRGEALFSISAVSRFRMLTREVEEAPGTEILAEGGRIISVSSADCPIGTEIEVKDLFFNMPARKKYLKTDRTELAHISQVVAERALAHPEIHFSFFHEKTHLFTTPGSGRLLDSIVAVMGSGFARSLIPISSTGEVQVSGFIAQPLETPPTLSHLFIFVNGRPVKNGLILSAVREGYGTMLMKGRQPAGLVFVDMAPEWVDVNIHPAKLEVRFSEDGKVFAAVKEAVRNSLGSQDLIPEQRGMGKRLDAAEKSLVGGYSGAARQSFKERSEFTQHEGRQTRLPDEAHEERKAGGGDYIWLSGEIIGQLWNTYILIQAEDEFLMIDQHAAHERVRYERLRRDYEDGVRSQELIVPIIMEMNARDVSYLSDFSEELKRLGLVIQPFGSGTIQISAVPVVMGQETGEDAVKELLGQIIEGGRIKEHRKFSENLLKLAACHGAIRAGDPLSFDRIRLLLKELAACENPFTCPHGRPTVVSMARKEVEKRFKRIV